MSNGSDNPIRVLILEDRGTDVELALGELRGAGFALDWKWASNAREFTALLDEPFDLILADYSLPQFNAVKALQILQQRQVTTPLIIVSGAVGEDHAVDAFRQGAVDFVHKNRLARLPQAVSRALEQVQLRAAHAQSERLLQQSEYRYRKMLEQSFEAVVLLDAGGHILDAAAGLTRLVGYTAHDLTGHCFLALIHREDRGIVHERWERLLVTPGVSLPAQYRVRHRDHSWRWVESRATNWLDDPGLAAVVENVHDITELCLVRDRRSQAA